MKSGENTSLLLTFNMLVYIKFSSINHSVGMYGINANYIAWNPQLVAAWNLASASMGSMPIALYGIKTEVEGIQPDG